MGIKTIPRKRAASLLLALIGLFAPFMVQGQSGQGQADQAQPEPAGAATLRGLVRDSSNHPVAGARVFLQARDTHVLIVDTDSAGAYRFSAVRQGTYALRAEMAGYGSATFGPVVLGQKESRTIDLTLGSERPAGPQNSSAQPPEFFDQPHFTVAGVTDTTNLGGHGSDTIVRNREALAKATVSLSQQSPGSSPLNPSTAAKENSLREAAESQPGSFDVNQRLGRLLVDEGKAKEGLPYLEQAFRLNPDDFDTAYELALAHAETGNYERARAGLRALLARQDKAGETKAKPHHLLNCLCTGHPSRPSKFSQKAIACFHDLLECWPASARPGTLSAPTTRRRSVFAKRQT
jgi:tetratricopeptide (TPR) repeat protein